MWVVRVVPRLQFPRMVDRASKRTAPLALDDGAALTCEISLAEAGALSATTDDDANEGRVERETDVLSEPPEIDTTRAETPVPRYARWCVLSSMACGVINLAGLALSVFAVVKVYGNPRCPMSNVAKTMATNFSLSELVEDARYLIEKCS